MPSTVVSRDARTGVTSELSLFETTVDEIGVLTQRAHSAVEWLRELGPSGRAGLLRGIADGIEAHRDELVVLADIETALGTARLEGEIARTAWQLRFLADVISDGAYLDLTVDEAVQGPIGPQPELRKMLVPLGPIAVFGASNFPFAFSTIGGDSASALAVGCPVLFKAHPGHTRTALAVDEIVRARISEVGGPDGVFCTVMGREAGVALVKDPNVTGVGFTGSLSGGRALFDLAVGRQRPIPFFGELGSLNPVVVTGAAAAERSAEIGVGLAGSLMLGAGQFCTKPGLILVPTGPDGDAVVAALAESISQTEFGPLLTERIQTQFDEQVQHTVTEPEVTIVASAPKGQTRGCVIQIDASRVLAGNQTSILEEHFGPFGVIIRYENTAQRDKVLAIVPAGLTGTVQSATADDSDLPAVVDILAGQSGRVVVNQYPTGVAVTWTMHHGGPYPASTDAAQTSVGAASVRRWLRPVAFQNTPVDALPAELRDDALEKTPHRLNGIQKLPNVSTEGKV